MRYGVDRAPNLNALRTVMRQLFKEVWLLPLDHPWIGQVSAMRESGVEAGGYLLLPILRESTVISRDRMDVATIRRATLAVQPETRSWRRCSTG